MIIEQLSIRHLRAFTTTDMDLDPGINLFVGQNGAGKTSVLESVHVLATGRSFRAAQLETIRQHGQSDLILAARVASDKETHQLGLRKQADGLTLRLDAAPAERLSDLARYLAVITLHADSDQLIQGGPQQRRRYLDWWLFHVQPNFFPEWLRFQRLLKQRNAALRKDPGQLVTWDEPLAASGEKVAAFRQKAAEHLVRHLEQRLIEFKDFPDFIGSLHPGWTRGETLFDVLQRTRLRDREQGFTAHGPHRAELRLQVMGKDAREVLSRGQQKTLATLMLLTLAETYRSQKEEAPIILLDDLAAELDEAHRRHLLHHLTQLGGQILLTALDKDEVSPWLPASTRQFAVQDGSVTML